MRIIRMICTVVLCMMATVTVIAQLEPEQKKFRDSVVQFLKEEGFSPNIDEDGDVAFKKEGELHWISVGTGNPIYLEFHRSGYKLENEDRNVLLKAVNYGNLKIPTAKAILSETSVNFVVELFCHSVEEFKFIFYKCMKSLENMENIVTEYYNENKSGSVSTAPFNYSSADVANVDKDGNIITSYGQTIYDYKTRYLKPRITVNVSQAGTYNIYVKMYTPSGNLSTGSTSPAGYSYYTAVSMTTGTHSYALDGWGSNTDGNWRAGTYRFEFYYTGSLLGTKYFTVQ